MSSSLLEQIIDDAYNAGTGTVSYFEKNGQWYILSSQSPYEFSEGISALFIVPADKMQKIQASLETIDEEVLVDKFWIKVNKYFVGNFEG